MISARPTKYKGIQMRSRLEARYAAQLDANAEDWKYEPECFANEQGQYLPDFLVIDDDRRIYIEVRPTINRGMDAMGQMEIIWSSDPAALLFIDIPARLLFVRVPGGPWRCYDRYHVFDS